MLDREFPNIIEARCTNCPFGNGALPFNSCQVAVFPVHFFDFLSSFFERSNHLVEVHLKV